MPSGAPTPCSMYSVIISSTSWRSTMCAMRKTWAPSASSGSPVLRHVSSPAATTARELHVSDARTPIAGTSISGLFLAEVSTCARHAARRGPCCSPSISTSTCCLPCRTGSSSSPSQGSPRLPSLRPTPLRPDLSAHLLTDRRVLLRRGRQAHLQRRSPRIPTLRRRATIQPPFPCPDTGWRLRSGGQVLLPSHPRHRSPRPTPASAHRRPFSEARPYNGAIHPGYDFCVSADQFA